MTDITHAFSAKTQRRIARFLLILGGLCLVGAVWQLYVEARFLHQATPTVGTVIAVAHGSKIPTVEFAVRSDTVVRFTPTSSDAFHRYSIGERLKVLYQTDDPGGAKLDQFLHLWDGTIACLVGGVFASVFGWLTLTGRGSWGPLKQARFTVD